MRFPIVLFFLTTFFRVEAQSVSGRISASNRVLSGVEVLNLVSEKSVKSTPMGDFSIEAAPGDLLLFYAAGHEPKRFLIEPEHLGQTLFVEMIPKPIELDEVVVTYDINPETLGLVPKGQKVYTVAERRLYTSRSGPLDGLINAINGKTEQRKREVEVEGKFSRRDQLTQMFEPSYFTTQLQIPELYVEGFKFYVLDDSGIIAGLRAKNKYQVRLHLSRLAPEYVKTIEN